MTHGHGRCAKEWLFHGTSVPQTGFLCPKKAVMYQEIENSGYITSFERAAWPTSLPSHKKRDTLERMSHVNLFLPEIREEAVVEEASPC